MGVSSSSSEVEDAASSGFVSDAMLMLSKVGSKSDSSDKPALSSCDATVGGGGKVVGCRAKEA